MRFVVFVSLKYNRFCFLFAQKCLNLHSRYLFFFFFNWLATQWYFHFSLPWVRLILLVLWFLQFQQLNSVLLWWYLKIPIKTTNSYKTHWLQIQNSTLNTKSLKENLPCRRCRREISIQNCSVTYIFSYNLLPDYSLILSRPEMCMYERCSVFCKLVLQLLK